MTADGARPRGSPVAASELLRQVLGPGRTGRVLGTFPSAVYLVLDDDLVAVEARDAVGLPCALVLPTPTRADPFAAVRAGDPVRVGDRSLDVGPLALSIARWWRPRQPRSPGAPFLTARLRLLDELLPPLEPVVAAVVPEVLRGEHVAGLLGLGSGLTPAGDDVLAGYLLACAGDTTTDGITGDVRRAVRALAARRTTTLSAALLHLALAGHALPAVVDLLDALHGAGSDGAAAEAVVRLLGTGHTSGTALAHGVRLAARVRRTELGTEVA